MDFFCRFSGFFGISKDSYFLGFLRIVMGELVLFEILGFFEDSYGILEDELKVFRNFKLHLNLLLGFSKDSIGFLWILKDAYYLFNYHCMFCYCVGYHGNRSYSLTPILSNSFAILLRFFGDSFAVKLFFGIL